MTWGRPISFLTPSEVISTINRSSLPTVITEGVDDYIAFRRIEENLVHLGVSVMPVGGRHSVLEIFDRRDEISADKKIAFFADKDIWVLEGIPDRYIDNLLIFTDGYSIENDLYRDGNLEQLLLAGEREEFQRDLKVYLKWYAFAIDRICSGADLTLDNHPNRVLSGGKLCPTFMAEVNFEAPPEQLYEKIVGDYGKYLRGKSLIELLVRYLSSKGRPAKYSKKALIDMGASKMGPLLKSASDRIETSFA